MHRNTAGVPIYKPDIYSVDAIVDPYPHCQRLRDLGPVVWLAKQKVYALPRYSECKAVLRDDKTFLSGAGVALNRITNQVWFTTTFKRVGRLVDSGCYIATPHLAPAAAHTCLADDPPMVDEEQIEFGTAPGPVDSRVFRPRLRLVCGEVRALSEVSSRGRIARKRSPQRPLRLRHHDRRGGSASTAAGKLTAAEYPVGESNTAVLSAS